ncbi:hypothetical protein BMS3Abin17_01229 [archaeon BMS3Abin17]|nr:hypothetical protein BMS3Abin17_01229 [archaeon BMS3Abin17]HDZ60433.1 hypothetical protein [Candidatus Pacearchaeota archaeon]
MRKAEMINRNKYYYVGMFLEEEIYLEKDMKLDWSVKIPLFFKIKFPRFYNFILPEVFQAK